MRTIKSELLTELDIKRMEKQMGKQMAHKYVEWSNENIENHINNWLEDNKMTIDDFMNGRVNTDALYTYCAEQFAKWYIGSGF